MSIGQTQEFSRAMALIGLAENAASSMSEGGDTVELADNISTSLRLAMELLESDHNAGGIGVAKGGAK